MHQLGSFSELSERMHSCRLCELLVQTCDEGLWQQVSREREKLYFSAAWTDAARERNGGEGVSEGENEETGQKLAVLMVFIKEKYEAGGLSLVLRPLTERPIHGNGNEDPANRPEEEEEEGHHHFAKWVDSELMDFQLAKSWLHGCENNHSCSATFTSLTGPYRPPAAFRCIDVDSMCIAQPPAACRYLTLSYIWGAGRKFVALQENIHALSQPGGLVSVLDRLSRTIRDALDVTRRLGEKYIWIDSLCIVQDGGEEKAAALRDMGLVYSQSLLMICAADDRCLADGLRGVRVPRQVKQYTREMAPGFTLAAQFDYEAFLEPSIYNSRGWT